MSGTVGLAEFEKRELFGRHFVKIILHAIASVAFAILGMAIMYSMADPREREFPPRDQFRNVYQTVHVMRWEKTVCYECHNYP